MRTYHFRFFLFVYALYNFIFKSLIFFQIILIIGEFVEIGDENIKFHILESSIRFLLIFLLIIINILKYVSIHYMFQNLELSKNNSMIRFG